MRTDELNVQVDESQLTPATPLSVVVVYEDYPARLRVQQVYWMLMRNLSGEFDIECSWCGFDDLNNPSAATRARAAAAAADLILFSVNVDSEPPPAVQAWIETWIEKKAVQDAALAALLSGTKRRHQRRMPIWNYLSRIAQRAGMSFLPEIIGPERVCGQAS